jgi:AbrB family looped-hinge helix DNA binding protein
MSSVTLSSKGQVTLPSEIRNHLGLHAGDQLLAEERDGTVVLRPVKYKDFFAACEATSKLYKGRTISTDEMRESWGEAAVERYKKSGRD